MPEPAKPPMNDSPLRRTEGGGRAALRSIGGFLLAVGIVIGAAVPRLADRGNRPMHCDEAVHGIKFGKLLEDDDYVYDPHEYHGPSLNFLTLPIARIASTSKRTEVTESELRLLPAIFGIALVGSLWLVRDELGRGATRWAALLTAVSPAMVYYSRYYIQEMLLVGFTLGAIVALCRWHREVVAGRGAERGPTGASRLRTVWWLVVLGLAVGMMHATKETCAIAIVSMVVAGAFGLAGVWRIGAKRLLGAALVVLPVAAGISALFFSSFFDNPRSVFDSYTTYFHYLGRASGDGSVGRHVYPPDYYFRILFWWRRGDGPVWSEASVALLALAGLAAVVRRKVEPSTLPALRFVAIYTLLMTAVYAALPYKTPWCALGFFHGMILLAGVGAAALVRFMPGGALKALATVALLGAAGHLSWQAWRASFVDYADAGNPYVYSHTTTDVFEVVERVEQMAACHPDGRAMHVQVICPDHDYWPLPWYLRGFGRVGWYDRPPAGPPAPLIVTQPDSEPALLDYLYVKQPPGQRHLYVPVAPDAGGDWLLRPHVPLRVYVRLDVFEDLPAPKGLPGDGDATSESVRQWP